MFFSISTILLSICCAAAFHWDMNIWVRMMRSRSSCGLLLRKLNSLTMSPRASLNELRATISSSLILRLGCSPFNRFRA